MPTRDNLRRWGVRHVDLKCKLCDRIAPTLRHDFASCPVALSQGRYTWRHDSVLAQVITCLEEGIRLGKRQHDARTAVPQIDATFVRAGESRRKHHKPDYATATAAVTLTKTECTFLWMIVFPTVDYGPARVQAGLPHPEEPAAVSTGIRRFYSR